MATTYKILGQVTPGTTAASTLYTVPSTTQVVVSSLVVCNLTTTARTYRLAIRPDGATLASSHYLAYDTTVAANDSTIMTIGATLDSTDVVTVQESAANTLTFTVFGAELT
jgi:hypothetical protein